jgi:hypothetical protein
MSTSATALTATSERLIDAFLPVAEHGSRHEILVRAPAEVVLDVACTADMQANPLVRGIFRLRELLLRSKSLPREPRGLLDETLSLGWGLLAHRPARAIVVGAVTQPWQPDVVFRSVPPERFRSFAEPGMVKIVWTLEAEPIGPALARFRTETRVVATDAEARRKFGHYWRVFGAGILLIRFLLLPRLRRDAERRYRASLAGSSQGAV